MASISSRTNKDGTTTHRVLWRQDGKQRSLSFVDLDAADKFRRNLEHHGPAEALSVLDIIDGGRHETVLGDWLDSYVDGLTGIQEGTRAKYRGFIRRDFPELVALPLSAVTEAAVGRWVARLEGEGAAGKTIQGNMRFCRGR